MINEIDETEKYKFGTDHIFDNKNLSAAFTGWKFENRLSSFTTFSKLAQDHFQKVKIDSTK